MAPEKPDKADKAPTPPQESSRQDATNKVAHLTVKLPSDARLWIDHVECPLTSAVRSFDTPPLEPGQKYVYTLRVQLQREGRTQSESRRVEVAAGRQIEVNFNQMGSATATEQR